MQDVLLLDRNTVACQRLSIGFELHPAGLFQQPVRRFEVNQCQLAADVRQQVYRPAVSHQLVVGLHLGGNHFRLVLVPPFQKSIEVRSMLLRDVINSELQPVLDAVVDRRAFIRRPRQRLARGLDVVRCGVCQRRGVLRVGRRALQEADLPDRTLDLQVCAVVKADAYDSVYYGTPAGTDRMPALAEKVAQDAVFQRDGMPSASDQVVALSTCASSGVNERTLLLCRVTGERAADKA